MGGWLRGWYGVGWRIGEMLGWKLSIRLCDDSLLSPDEGLV